MMSELEKVCGDISDRYYVREESKPSRPGCWDILDVIIFKTIDEGTGQQIGQYERNYPSLYNTFAPFMQHGKEYALYSSDYTSTRIMTLPDCKDLCGEERNEWGFCPTDYYVPYEPELGIHGEFGFVAGCVWGDDSSWKIQFLDLRRIQFGEIKRDDRFGYLELPDDIPLKDCVDTENYFVKLDGKHTDRTLSIASRTWFRQDDDLNTTFLSGYKSENGQ